MASTELGGFDVVVELDATSVATLANTALAAQTPPIPNTGLSLWRNAIRPRLAAMGAVPTDPGIRVNLTSPSLVWDLKNYVLGVDLTAAAIASDPRPDRAIALSIRGDSFVLLDARRNLVEECGPATINLGFYIDVLPLEGAPNQVRVVARRQIASQPVNLLMDRADLGRLEAALRARGFAPTAFQSQCISVTGFRPIFAANGLCYSAPVVSGRGEFNRRNSALA